MRGLQNSFQLIVYAAFLAGANMLSADEANLDALMAARTGDMQKLELHAPKPASHAEFLTADGRTVNLFDFKGEVALVNFWATWCAPCREEMPSLNALKNNMNGKGLTVAAIATGRNPLPAIESFFDANGIDSLEIYRDPDKSLAAEMGALYLPVTFVLNKKGEQIGILRGDADWNSAQARALLTAIVQAQ